MTGKYKVVAVIMATIALVFALPLASCFRGRQAVAGAAQTAGAPRPASGPQQSSGAAASQSSAPRLGAPAALAAPEASPAPAPVLAASLRAYGLGADRPISPEDMDIGALQDLRHIRGAAKDAVAVAERFMGGLEAGKLDPELFDPAARPALALLLAPDGPGPNSSRLGAITVEGDSASFEIGLPRAGSPARDRWKLSLGLSDGRWYVEAFARDPRADEPGARVPRNAPTARL